MHLFSRVFIFTLLVSTICCLAHFVLYYTLDSLEWTVIWGNVISPSAAKVTFTHHGGDKLFGVSVWFCLFYSVTLSGCEPLPNQEYEKLVICKCCDWKVPFFLLFPFCSLDSSRRLQNLLKEIRTHSCTLLTKLVTSTFTTWRSLFLSKNHREVCCIFFLFLIIANIHWNYPIQNI